MENFCVTINGFNTFEEEVHFIPADSLQLAKWLALSVSAHVSNISISMYSRVRFLVQDGKVVRSSPSLDKFYLDVSEEMHHNWAGFGTL